MVKSEKCDGSCGKIDLRTFHDKNRNVIEIMWLTDGQDVKPFMDVFCLLNPSFLLYVYGHDEDLFCYGHD